MSEFTQGHALLVGVGADLPNTVTDAKGLGKILVDEERCAYRRQQVSVCTGEKATRENILTELEKLSKIDSDSNVIIYFSGHGYRVERAGEMNYYLMPFGYNVRSLKKTAISGEEFNEAIKNIRAKSILILLDCCHAGGIGITKSVDNETLMSPDDVEMTKAPLPPEATQLFAKGSGRFLIASSKAKELSYAGKPYSAFTAALIEALCGKDVQNQDGYVRVTDLMTYTIKNVPLKTSNKQNPIIGFQDATDFEMAYYAGGDTQPKALPFKAEELEIEAMPGESNPNPRITWNGNYIGGDNIGGDSMNAGGQIIKTESGNVTIVGRDAFTAEGDMTINRGSDKPEDKLSEIFKGLKAQAVVLLSDLQKLTVNPLLTELQTIAQRIQKGDESTKSFDDLKEALQVLVKIAPEFGKSVVNKLSAPAEAISSRIREAAEQVDGLK